MPMLLTALRGLLAVAAAYAIGCFCTAYYLVRWRTGQDLRTLGTGTVGGRNAGRVLGAPGLVVTAIGDLAKGALAIVLVHALGLTGGVAVAALFAVVAGHIWPAQLGFRGGKGVATGAGALAVLDPVVLGVLVVVAGVALLAFRHTKPAGLTAIALLPVIPPLLGRSAAFSVAMLALSALVLFAHRDDLRALRAERAAA